MLDLFVIVSEEALRDAVLEQLAVGQFKPPIVCKNAKECLANATSQEACLVLLDEIAYNADAAELFRARNEIIPPLTLLLMGRGEESEAVSENFRLPLRLGHLMARLRYHSQTAPLLRDKFVEFGPYLLEVQNRRLVIKSNSDTIKLTEKETALLLFLAERKEVATRRDILADVWGYDERIDTHTLETHLYQLRRKLEKEGGEWLIFENGAYRLAQAS